MLLYRCLMVLGGFIGLLLSVARAETVSRQPPAVYSEKIAA